MTRNPDGWLASTALCLLVAVSCWAPPANAEGVPASFDCAKAGNAVEKFICSQAVLRWHDLALSRSYAAARAKAIGSARDDLLASQRDWVRERDRRCIADRSFEKLSAPSTTLRSQAFDCLQSVYISRRRDLQDVGLMPMAPTGISEIDLKPIAAARPEIAEGTEPRIAGINSSPGGSMLAILLPSMEIDVPDQIWLYRIADRKLVAATPKPDQQHPHPDGSPLAINSLAWQGDTLYARVAVSSKDGQGEEGTSIVYAATMDASRQLHEVPANIYALLDDASQPGVVGQDEVPESDWDILETIRGNPGFLAWAYDLGHGTIELRTRKRVSGSPVYLVAWGSWSLWRYLFDTGRSQLVYSADTGITVFDMTTRGERRIAGTSRGDKPYAISADRSLFVWSTRNQCGDEFLTEQDESKPERFCLAHLPQLKAGE
ncbi:lysozyme inhibitor LprI family protein [Nitrobacteraceae bacterium UC4446_H13]